MITSTLTLEALLAVGGNEWRTEDKHRVYFNDLHELFGLDPECATLDGEKISNTRSREIDSSLKFGKVWYDLDAGGFFYRIGDCRTFSAAEMGNAIITEIKRRIRKAAASAAQA